MLSNVSIKVSVIYGGTPTIYELMWVVGDTVADSSGLISGAFPHAFRKITDIKNSGNIVFKIFSIEIDCIKAVLFVRVSAGVS